MKMLLPCYAKWLYAWNGSICSDEGVAVQNSITFFLCVCEAALVRFTICFNKNKKNLYRNDVAFVEQMMHNCITCLL